MNYHKSNTGSLKSLSWLLITVSFAAYMGTAGADDSGLLLYLFIQEAETRILQ